VEERLENFVKEGKINMKLALSIVIVNYNTRLLVKKCIKSVIKNTQDINYEILVIDNGSIDGSQKTLDGLEKRYKNIKLVKNKKNLGFAAANNQGMKLAEGDFVLLLNSDTIISDNAIGKMADWMKNKPEVGISSCMLKDANGDIQGTGGYFPELMRVFSWMIIQDIPFVDAVIKPFHPVKSKSIFKGYKFYEKERELDWITGAFFMIRKEVISDIGYFDEGFFMYVEEVDYCYRAKNKGWKVYYTPLWEITHFGGASGDSWSFVIPEFEGIKMFYKKHYPKWQFPVLRILLKTGALWRMCLFGILKGKGGFQAYAKAYKKA